MICGVLKKDMADEMRGWGEWPVEMGDVVLDIERLVFKDLVGETIRELASFSPQSQCNNKLLLPSLRRKLVFWISNHKHQKQNEKKKESRTHCLNLRALAFLIFLFFSFLACFIMIFTFSFCQWNQEIFNLKSRQNLTLAFFNIEMNEWSVGLFLLFLLIIILISLI